MNHEFEAISRLFQQRVNFKHPTTHIKNGDDASVHKIPKGFECVISVDSAVEHVHWPADMPLDIAGNRAICAALSDLAAMGAEPAWIWIAVMAKDKQSLSQMSHGIVDACLTHHLELAGGDTVGSATNAITVTVGGLVPSNFAMTRNTAKNGDEIWLVGDIGLSAAGLKQWLAGNKNGDFVTHFQNIQPRHDLGVKLRNLDVKCCLDISDGLLQDASHIAKASNVGINFELSAVKYLTSYQSLLTHFSGEESLKLMLSGGEDYALLCTAPPSLHQDILSLGASKIGYCVSGHEVKLCHQGDIIDYNIKGFDHFG
ncbi:MAG: thiamine-phosphate kinase [Ghiorsea sp.]